MGTFDTDVISGDARFASITRVADSPLLEPMTRRLVEGLLTSARQMGIDVMMYETYRSKNRQEALFENGASKLRSVGVHNYGLACDIVRRVSNEPSWKGDFSFLGELARSCGLIWGGDWGDLDIKHSFIDSVHVQRCTIARQGELFAGLWYPDASYNPYDDTQLLSAGASEVAATQLPAKTSQKARNRRAGSQRA